MCVCLFWAGKLTDYHTFLLSFLPNFRNSKLNLFSLNKGCHLESKTLAFSVLFAGWVSKGLIRGSKGRMYAYRQRIKGHRATRAMGTMTPVKFNTTNCHPEWYNWFTEQQRSIIKTQIRLFWLQSIQFFSSFSVTTLLLRHMISNYLF